MLSPSPEAGTVNRPHLHTLKQLRQERPGTLAEQMGLVVRVDRMASWMLNVYNHHLDFAALYVVRSGRGIHWIAGEPHGIARGDVYYMPPETTHAYQRFDALVLDAVYLDPAELAPLVAGELPTGGKWGHLSPSAYGTFRRDYERLEEEWRGRDRMSSALCQGALNRMVAGLARTGAGQTTTARRRADRETLVADALTWLDREYPGEARVSVLARELGVTPGYLTTLFRQTVGRTPRDYLAHVRVEAARRLLRETSQPVGEIGLRCGYPDPAAFHHAFRRAEGRGPLAYRRELDGDKTARRHS